VVRNIYDFQLVDSSAVLTVPSIDCTSILTSCSVSDQLAAVLTIDLTGLPSSGYVYIVLKAGELLSPFRYVYNAGGTLHQLEVLALPNITVSVYESYSGVVQYDANNIDCSSGICSAGNVTSNLSVNLTGVPSTAYANLVASVGSRGVVRQISPLGTGLQSYSVVRNIYDFQLVDSSAVLTVQSIDCTSILTSCSVSDQLAAVLTIDLTGLPSSGYVYIVLKAGELLSPFRYVYNAGGTLHQLEVLALPNITVSVYESYSGVVQYNANNIDCSSGICSAGIVTSNLSVNLTGVPSTAYANLVASVGNRGVVRQISPPGTGLQSYSVVRNIYDFQLVDSSAVLTVQSIDCTSILTPCSVSDQLAAVLTVDLTGLSSSSNVYIVLKAGELLSPFRYVYNAGVTLHQLEVLALPNITVSVYESYYGVVQYNANNIDCSSGICSAGIVTSNLSVNLVGLSTNTYVKLLDTTGSFILRQFPVQGGSIQSYTVICGISYQIDVLSQFNTLIRRYISNICICGGSCTLTSIVV
jgi:phage gp45-like